MKRPLFSLAIFFSIGIFVADFLPFKIACGLGLSTFLALAIFPFISKESHSSGFLYLLFLLLGIGVYVLRAYFPSTERVDQGPHVDRMIRLRGKVVEILGRGGILKVHWMAGEDDKWHKARGRVFLVMARHGVAYVLEESSEIEVEGEIIGFPLERINKLKSYDRWLRTKEIAAVVRVLTPQDIRGIYPSHSFLEKLKSESNRNLSKGLQEGAYPLGLLRAMILGDRTDLDPSIKQVFLNTNTVHILSISGLHLGIILLAILFMTQLFYLPPRWGFGVTLVSIWIYGLMTGLSPPILRSVIMSTFFLVGRLCLKKVDLVNSLGAAALMMLALHPFLIFDPGFQLSFLCVISLIFLTPFFERILTFLRIVPGDVISSLQYGRDRILAKGMDWIVRMLSASLAVWVGVIPVIAYHFEIFSPVTVLANLIVVPWVGLVMMIAFMSTLLGFVDWIGLSLNAVNEVLLVFLVQAIKGFSNIPGAYFSIPKPNGFLMSGYYCVMLMVGIIWIKGCREGVTPVKSLL